MNQDLLIRSDCIVTCKEGSNSTITDGFIVVSNGRIKWTKGGNNY